MWKSSTLIGSWTSSTGMGCRGRLPISKAGFQNKAITMSDLFQSYSRAFPKGVVDKVETPCFIISEQLIRMNLERLLRVKKRTNSKILLALKAFAAYSTFPLISKYLDGVCASGTFEARLGREEFGKEVHTYSPAYSKKDIEDVIKYSDVIIFNSVGQWKEYRERIRRSGRRIQVGLRVNPGLNSSLKIDKYNPTLPGSRLGISKEELEGEDLSGIDGLHFHALCEQNSTELAPVLRSFERSYGKYIRQMKWVNFGGGHHITRKDYDRELLIRLINSFKSRYGVEVHLEPGEAVVLNAGVLVSSVLDVKRGSPNIAILDTSAEAHMPDVLAAPYRPKIIGAGMPGELGYTYRLGGMTCLAGDVIGDYSFAQKLVPGQRIVFLDMAHYSMVKTTTFNGIKLPDIAVHRLNGKLEIVKKFGYSDYKSRL
ncbi:MAG: carboxynorspermidine decarboxylase [Candidatus Micrarchaeaceae archaeon]